MENPFLIATEKHYAKWAAKPNLRSAVHRKYAPQG
jgi:hypothetical protein